MSKTEAEAPDQKKTAEQIKALMTVRSGEDEWQVGPLSAAYVELARNYDDVFHFMNIYFHGFEIVTLWANSGWRTDRVIETRTRTWIHPSQRVRSMTMLAATMGVFLTVALERFMNRVSAEVARNPTQCVKRRWRNAKRSRQNPALTLEEFLSGCLAPTAKDGGEYWIKALHAYVGADISKPVSDTVCAMLSWRNNYVHASAEVPELVEGATPDRSENWALAVRQIGREIALGWQRVAPSPTS